MIRSERPVAAPAAIVHAVLTDVTAWKLWAPHVASVDCVADVIRDTAWSGLVKPWLGPAAQMDVTWVEPGAECGGPPPCSATASNTPTLITPDGDDRCLVTMTAEVSGVVGTLSPRPSARSPASGSGAGWPAGTLAEYLHRPRDRVRGLGGS